MTSSMKMVTVISSDGEEFEMPINAAEQSKQIKCMLDDLDGNSDKVPLYNVNSATLAKVIEYCRKHADHEAAGNGGAPAASAAAVEELEKWDAEFLRVDFDLLFDIILAANYLNIKALLDSSCQAVADRIKDETPERIRQIFKIENDFTPQEEENLRNENRWAFE